MKYPFLIISLLLTIATKAQQTNFSGTFAIDKTQTDFGNAPEWILPKAIKVEQQPTGITINRTLLDDQMVEHPTKDVLNNDGTAFGSVSPSGKKQSSTLRWNVDHQSFVEHIASTTTDGQTYLDITESWSLSSDGNNLIIDRSVTQSNGAKYTIKAFYKRTN